MNQAEDRSLDTSSLSGPAPDDPRVIQAMEEYQTALEAGRKLDRQAFLARHADLAGVLAGCLDGLEFMQAAVPQLHDGAEEEAASTATAVLAGTPLGDFRILCELGRGGMGVVYEAEQLSLGRRVALKVLPFAATLDPKQLQRFRNEAQAAAHLHHQHIVPVYAVGCERGVHYYAMQFIEGKTLATLIGERRHQTAPGAEASGKLPEETVPVAVHDTQHSTASPAYLRTVAQLGVQAAEALEYAHQVGVVHRDIKPANLLVDGGGNLWITDFGLAQCQGQAGLTLTGDVAGTLRYMSPEQALARRGTVDHRTDLYSLGATLYELLTLEPALPGSDRQELLARIAFEEPRPPRRLNPAIPADLETVVLKALAKAPEERYVTAQELADDLRRFLDDKPIKAKRPTLRQRTARWARRHKAVVRAAMVVLALAVAALAVSTVFIWRAKEDLKQSLERERQLIEQERQNSYYTHIALAERNLAAGNVAWAEELLDLCPSRLRGLEWHFLKRRRYGDLPPLRHDGPLYRTAFSPNGRQIAAGAQDGTVLVWDARTGNTLHTLPQGKGMPVHHLTYSPDSRYLAAAMHTGRVLVWDMARDGCLHTLEAHQGRIWQVAFSPDSRQLASTGNDRCIRLWDVRSWKEVDSLPGQDAPVMGVAFHSDGRLVTAGRDGTVKVWDLATRQKLSSYNGPVKYVGLALFSPDCRRLAWATNEGIVKVWDTATGQEQFPLQGHTFDVRGVAFSPDGQRLATAGFDKTIRLWDAATGKETLTIHGHADGVNNVAFSPDGKRLISASNDHTLRVWDARPLTSEPPTGPVRTLSGQPHLLSVAFSPNGERLAAGSLDGTVTVWDAASRRQAWTIRAHADHARGVAFSPDGLLLASASWDGTVKLWEAATGRGPRVLSVGGVGASSVTFSPDGLLLAAGTQGGAVIWDTKTWEQVGTPLKGTTSPVPSVAFGRDSHRLITAGASQQIAQLWDVSARTVIHTLEGHGSPVNGVAFSPDGKLIATGSNDQTVKVWDAATGEVVHTLPGHEGYVWRVAFSPDGRYLASGSWDSTVKVWDLKAPESAEPVTLRGHAGTIGGVAFSPDGKRLASASGYASKGEIKVWDATLWEKKASGER